MYKSKTAERNLFMKKNIFVIWYVYVLTRTKNTTLKSTKHVKIFLKHIKSKT